MNDPDQAATGKTIKWLIVMGTFSILVLIPVAGYRFLPDRVEPFFQMYRDKCAICHGDNLEGAPQGPALVGRPLQYGDTVDEIREVIRAGKPAAGMPAWAGSLEEAHISNLAILVAEKRQNFSPGQLSFEGITLPEEVFHSELHDFRVELFADDLDPLVFSITALPDGSFLLTEKERGISIIGADGRQSELIKGTPGGFGDSLKLRQINLGLGWLLDIAIHPDYEQNGWIYLHYGDRIDSTSSVLPVSMNRLDRARIRNGKWVDVETIWQAHRNSYTSVPDIGAGGRIAFDDSGHVYLSVGMKASDGHGGIQDLRMPYGKIHRVRDDGSIPQDNPFFNHPRSLKSIWTFGHRNPQGLEFNRRTGQLWGSEMGPRGGDEVNLLLPGRNYGWPLHSKGVDYDGTPVEYGKVLGIEFDLSEIEQPIVDFTPAPAISSFVFYEGSQFPGWQQHMIIGSLKATELYRLVFESSQLVHRETLISGLARIRDVEVGSDGLVYLLLESRKGSKIVRLVPVQVDHGPMPVGTGM